MARTGEREIHMEFWSVNKKERDNLEDTGTDKMII